MARSWTVVDLPYLGSGDCRTGGRWNSRRLLIGRFECVSHGLASGGGVKVEEDLLKVSRLESEADSGHALGGVLDARTALQSQRTARLRAVLVQKKIHRLPP